MPARLEREVPGRGEDVVIAGAGAVCGAGVGLSALLAVACGEGGAGVQVDEAAMKVERLVPARRLRRLGHGARMMLVAAREALDGVDVTLRSQIGLICGTGVGSLEETTEFLGQLRRESVSGASPSLFPNSVMSATAGYLSLELGLRGYSATVTQDALSGELAITSAADALRLGRASMILAGGFDERSAATRAAFQRTNASKAATKLGEGAAMLLLCRGASIPFLARLAGYATVGLNGGGGAPALTAGRRALEAAGIGPDEIAAVIARDETMAALDELLGDERREAIARHGGAIVDIAPRVGCWGAMGALNVALGVAMIAGGTPSVLVCGQTSSVPADVSGEPTSLATAIVLSSGSRDVVGA